MSSPDRSDLTARLADLADRLATLSRAVEQLPTGLSDATRSDGSARPRPDPDGTEPPRPLYDSVDDWTAQFFAHVYTRPVGGDLRWCTRWYEHAEAAIRLELLWRSWEVYRHRPLGAVEWHRDILDHQLPILLGDRGPFAACAPDRHELSIPLQVHPTPPGWWDRTDTSPSTGLRPGDPDPSSPWAAP